jgi:hypothetical protein
MVITDLRAIRVSDPAAYAWAGLRRFQEVGFVTSRIMEVHQLADKHRPNAEKQAAQIRYCLTQAREYFTAARAVSLATKPNLLYYGTMSLALAEILLKKTGDSSLDRARAMHRHHGLSFVETLPSRANIFDLVTASSNLRALPHEIKGARVGTFELWHSAAREWPLGGILRVQEDEGGIERFTMLLGPRDERLPLLPTGGLSLLDCFKGLPRMADFVAEEGVTPTIARCKIEREMRGNSGHQTTTLAFHPGEASMTVFNNLRIPAGWVNLMDISQVSGGFILRYRYDPAHSSLPMRLPHGSMHSHEEACFWTDDQCLNEFGFYYVALFIAGNFARYYPDKWLLEVERSTPLARAIEELTNLSDAWIPWLTLSELSGTGFVAET